MLPVIVGAGKNTPFTRKFPRQMHAKNRYLATVENIALPDVLVTKGVFNLTDDEKNKPVVLALREIAEEKVIAIKTPKK